MRLKIIVALLAFAGLLLAAGPSPAGASPAPGPLTERVTDPARRVPALPALPGRTQSGQVRSSGAAGQALVGLFSITNGSCAGSTVTGSTFRMIQSGGSKSGPFVSNSDSPCADKNYSPLLAGSDGGLVTTGYQPQPSPAFDSTGGGRASRILKPVKFFGANFAGATNATDPQTGTTVAAPSITVSGGALSGDLRSYAAAWNGQHFNQGAPKPDGSRPGLTTGPDGTYDAASGRYTLEWTSQIVGGPFNNFIGWWHLEGTFTARAARAPSRSGADTSGSTSTNTGTQVQSGRLALTGLGWQPLAGAAELGGAAALAGLLGDQRRRLRRRREPR